MNFKSIISRVASVLPGSPNSMAQRVATVSGCEALIGHYKTRIQQLEDAPRFAGMMSREANTQVQHLQTKIKEVKRVMLRLTIEEESPLIDRDNKRDLDAANQQNKVLTGAHNDAAAALAAAEGLTSAMQGRIDATSVELAAVRAAADTALEAARTDFKAIFEAAEHDAERERAAAQEVQRLQRAQADAGSELALRIEGMNHQLRRLQNAETAAREKLVVAARDLAVSTLRRHELRMDIAAKAQVDAWLLGSIDLMGVQDVLPAAEVEFMDNSKDATPSVSFFDKRRCPAGNSLISDRKLGSSLRTMLAALGREPNLQLLAGDGQPVAQPDGEVRGDGLMAPAVG